MSSAQTVEQKLAKVHECLDKIETEIQEARKILQGKKEFLTQNLETPAFPESHFCGGCGHWSGSVSKATSHLTIQKQPHVVNSSRGDMSSDRR